MIYLFIEVSIMTVVSITISFMQNEEKKWISKSDFEGYYFKMLFYLSVYLGI